MSKASRAVLEKYDLEKSYSLKDASNLIKEITTAKFD